jgi:hypothetical protein
MLQESASRLFILLFFVAAVVGAPKEKVLSKKVWIDPVLTEKNEIGLSMKEKAGIGPINKESTITGAADNLSKMSISAWSSATIKNIRDEARPKTRKSTDFDNPVTPLSSQVEEGIADDLKDARSESGKVSLQESGDLSEGGRSNEGTMFEWILNLWKSFRNGFSPKLLTIFEIKFNFPFFC